MYGGYMRINRDIGDIGICFRGREGGIGGGRGI